MWKELQLRPAAAGEARQRARGDFRGTVVVLGTLARQPDAVHLPLPPLPPLPLSPRPWLLRAVPGLAQASGRVLGVGRWCVPPAAGALRWARQAVARRAPNDCRLAIGLIAAFFKGK